MKIPYQWLTEFVDCPLSLEDLKERLTFLGLEVESVERTGEGLDSILVGEVLWVKPHPKSDRLFLTGVLVGDTTLSIVAGADNMKVGDKVPVAPPGSSLPSGKTIGEALIQGVSSEGMLCSGEELQLSDVGDRIFILPSSAKVGQTLESQLSLNDVIFHLDLTPNYGHALSILGVAREVSALTGNQLKMIKPSFAEEGPRIEDLIQIQILAEDLCLRYSARIIQGIQLKPSPFWMQQRLRAVGIRPINNVVDITNYVMMELGQPLHAFDYAKISKEKILVRRAKEGEVLLTLDGEKRELVLDDLLIADPEKAVGLAGVMGGLNSEVTQETSSILLESAHFHPTTVRKTSRRLGLPSEASRRFERGVDIGGTLMALDRAGELLERYGGGTIARGVIDVYPHPKEENQISLRLSRVNQILGLSLSSLQITEILLSLGMEVRGEEPLEVIVPTFRMDIQEEIDLIEEIARHHGYEKIPLLLPQRMGKGGLTSWQKKEKKVRSLLQAMGLWEIITFSFVNPRHQKDFHYRGEEGDWLYLKNPLSEDLLVMRTSLLPGLVETLLLNQNRQQEDLLLFEMGKVFLASKGGSKEFLSLGVLSSAAREDSWGLKAETFYHVKGILEGLLKGLNIKGLSLKPGNFSFLHPGRSALLLLDGEEIGYLGEISLDLRQKYDLRQRPSCLELNLTPLLAKGGVLETYQPLPRYPGLKRDLALVVDEPVTSCQINSIIQKEGGDLLQGVKVFDLYQGPQVGEGKKSLAFTLTFYSRERTLKDREVDEILSKMLRALREELGAKVRE